MTILPTASRSRIVRIAAAASANGKRWPTCGVTLPVAVPVEQAGEQLLIRRRIEDRRRTVGHADERDRTQDRLVQRDPRDAAAGEPDDQIAPVPREAAHEITHVVGTVGHADVVERHVDSTPTGQLAHTGRQRPFVAPELVVVDDVVGAELPHVPS